MVNHTSNHFPLLPWRQSALKEARRVARTRPTPSAYSGRITDSYEVELP